MATLRIKSTIMGAPTYGFVYPAWAAATVYPTGAIIRAVVSNVAYLFQATTGGTSGSSAPSWTATFGATYTDNTVTWTNIGQVTTTQFMDVTYKQTASGIPNQPSGTMKIMMADTIAEQIGVFAATLGTTGYNIYITDSSSDITAIEGAVTIVALNSLN